MSLPESFKVFKKKVVVIIGGKEEVFELLPLSGAFYGDFLLLFNKMIGSKVDKDAKPEDVGNDIINRMTKADFDLFHKLLLETFVTSYDAKGDEVKSLDLFISKNLLSLMPVLMKVNLPDDMYKDE